jgi:long-chain acyl-CoA synthetase
VQHAVDDANAAVSQAESIRAFSIMPLDWTEDSGDLTPTLKLKRGVVQRRHHRDIELLYP